MQQTHPWWQRAVVYQIYPKSFMDSNGDGVGDLKGICQKLPYLKELGVDVLWPSPFYPSPGFDNGYDISDYESVDSMYGTDADFDRLVAAAHKLGMRVIIDLVVNHTSNRHPWFLKSRQSRDNGKADWYIWRDGINGAPPNRWRSQFGGSAWTYDENRKQYYLHLFSPYQPDLNWACQEVREEVYAMMQRWLNRGVDGFRMDVISLIAKPEPLEVPSESEALYDWHQEVANRPKVHEYLKEMHRRVLDHEALMTVGETSAVTIDEAKKYANADGSELNMVFQFEHVGLDGGETFKWTLQKIQVPDLKRVLNRWQTELEGKAWNSLYWCNHDQPRIVSRLGDEGIYRERSAKMLATCIHFMKGTPYIFQGEELGMTNFPFRSKQQLRDIESINAWEKLVGEGQYTEQEMLEILSQKSRDNARTPMQWENVFQAGFTSGTPWMEVNPNYQEINAADQVGRENSVFCYYQKLISLRHQNDCMAYGIFTPIEDDNPGVYAYYRTLQNERLTIVCNFTGKSQTYPLPETEGGAILLSNVPKTDYLQSGCLQPWEAIVIQNLDK